MHYICNISEGVNYERCCNTRYCEKRSGSLKNQVRGAKGLGKEGLTLRWQHNFKPNRERELAINTEGLLSILDEISHYIIGRGY